MHALAITVPQLAKSTASEDARRTALYLAHRERVFHWAIRYTAGRVSEAEDLTHDVFVRAFDQLDELEDLEDIGGWLYRVTANFALLRMRRDRIWISRVARLLAPPEPEPPPDLTVALKDSARRMLDRLAALPPKERVVVSMKLLDGKSQREIGAALGLSEGYVSKLLNRALDRLRDTDGGPDDGQP